MGKHAEIRENKIVIASPQLKEGLQKELVQPAKALTKRILSTRIHVRNPLFVTTSK